MKHFVYLDTDLINSYLAQIDEGLTNMKQTEIESIRTESKTQENVPGKDRTLMSIGLSSLLNFQYELEDEHTRGINAISHTEAGKEILSKIIHDNSYDNLISYLRSTSQIKNFNNDTKYNIGDYLMINDNFKMVDLSIIANLFSEDFKKVYNSMLSGEFESTLQNLNREQKRSNEVRKKEKEIKNKISSDLKMFDYVVGMITYISKLLPSSKYIVYENLFIPLNEKYLRENYISLRYKYTSSSTIVGQVTGNLRDILDFRPNNELDEIIKAVDVMLFATLKILSINENFKVVNPIAWYY